MTKRGRIRPSAELFHVRKLIEQRGDAARRKIVSQLLHEGVQHAGPSAVRHHEARLGFKRSHQDPRDSPPSAYFDVQGLGLGRGHTYSSGNSPVIWSTLPA